MMKAFCVCVLFCVLFSVMMSTTTIILFAAAALLALRHVHATPLTCQPNDQQPMMPIFHIIGEESSARPVPGPPLFTY
jgi:hypothetical protein